MAKKHPKTKKRSTRKHNAVAEAAAEGLLAQFDALVTTLCNACCVQNYYTSQREELIAALTQLTNDQLENVGGINIRYDITADYGDSEKIHLMADAVVLTAHSTAGPEDVFEEITWGGHLKNELRGSIRV